MSLIHTPSHWYKMEVETKKEIEEEMELEGVEMEINT